MRHKTNSRTRRLLLAICAVFALGAIGAGSAAAASSIQVTTDNNQANQLTAVQVTTALSGSGTAKKQFGATINMPASLHLDYYSFGAMDSYCSGGSVKTVSTSLGNVRGFEPNGCSEAAKVGTATLGSLSGPIYVVRTTPLPTLAAYFNQGTSSPFGRMIDANWEPGSTGAASLTIRGLPNNSTSGLSLNFSNPSRPSGFSSKIFRWAEPGTSGCTSSSQVTGQTYHWPWFVWPGWSTATVTTATPADLTLAGCDYFFDIGQSTTQAGAPVRLYASAGVYDGGARQYGQTIDLPYNIWNNWEGWSGPMCSGASVAVASTGITPVARSFDPSGCPAGSIVGSATLGSQQADIYWVNTKPMASFGIWFKSGVATPYGRHMLLDWDAGDELLRHRPQLRVFGLQGAPNSTLRIDLPGANNEPPFSLAPAGTDSCETGVARATIYTYPDSGTVATAHGPLTGPDPIAVTGC